MTIASNEITFATAGCYEFASDATKASLIDQLVARANQLSAMLHMVTGDGFENFETFAEKPRHDYLWACDSLAEEIKELAAKL